MRKNKFLHRFLVAVLTVSALGERGAWSQEKSELLESSSAAGAEATREGSDADTSRPKIRQDRASTTQDVGSRLEQVVVTARKTEESLQQVPLSIVAITAEDLQERSLDNLSSVGQATPNVNIGMSGALGRGTEVAFIRGVGESQTNPGINFDPAVGIYIDGVYAARPQGNDFEMLDIDRVEMLFGPQGTLFGRNSSAGAINIIAKRPDSSADRPSGTLRATVGSLSRLDGQGSVNIPLVANTLAIRVTAGRRAQNGFGERADGGTMGDWNRQFGRASLLWSPTDRFSALLTADGTTYREHMAVEKLVYLAGNFAALGLDDRYLSPGDFFNFATEANSSRGNIGGFALTLQFNAGWADLKSITAYRRFDIHSDQDADLSPVRLIDYFNEARQHQVSEEIQATGRAIDDRLDWVFGTYYFYENISTPREGNYYVLLADIAPCGPDTCPATQSMQLTHSYAAYAQANYKLLPNLRLTAGLRVTHDSKDFEQLNFSFPTFSPVSTIPSQSRSWNDLSPRIGLDYQWTPNIMTYISIARGYKGGGFSGNPPSALTNEQYGPEHVLTYELGLRSDLFDQRVRFNATAFYSDYSNLQVLVGGSTPDASGVPVSYSVVDNIPKSRIVGGETQLTLVPARGLTLICGLGITHAKYVDLPTDAFWLGQLSDAGNGLVVTRQSEFPNTPKLSLSSSVSYGRALGPDLSALARVDYSYKSKIYYDLQNSPHLVQPGYGVLDARLTFNHEPSGLSLSVFGTNLTNRRYFTGGYDDAEQRNPGLGIALQNMAAPREWGVTVQWQF